MTTIRSYSPAVELRALTAGHLELRAAPSYAAAFSDYLRAPSGTAEGRGLQRIHLSGSQLRSMGVAGGTVAGDLVPEAFEAAVLRAMLNRSAMRKVASIRPTESGADLVQPTSDDTSNTGELVTEGATVTEQDPVVGRITLRAFLYSSKLVKVSWQLMGDAGAGFEPWLAATLGERVARILNTHCTTGDGNDKPYGITQQAAAGVTGPTGTATAILWDSLIELQNSVDAEYRFRPSAGYMVHSNTLSYICRITDGNGRTMVGTDPATRRRLIDGYPVEVNNNMPAMGAGNRSVIFGDLAQYAVRDVRGAALVRLDEVYAESGQTGFIYVSRHDGVLLNAGQNPVAAYVHALA